MFDFYRSQNGVIVSILQGEISGSGGRCYGKCPEHSGNGSICSFVGVQ